MFNPWQKLALKFYWGGEKNQYKSIEEIQGDGLLLFLMHELGDENMSNGSQLDLMTARQRIATAISNLQEVLDNFPI
jgi:hypothetical protein|tara:strand:+ start:481 stop:711 length:231 start_codon:yes stop_codon:yes gene_type:complete